MYAQAPGGSPSAPPSRGFPAWGIVAIIGGVVAVAAVVTIILATRESDPVQTTGPPQEQGSVEQLTAYLPSEVTNCQNRSPSGFAYEGWIAQVVCEPTTGDPAFVGFYLYESPEAARSAYDEELAFEQVTIDSGDCSVDSEAEHVWSGGGGQGRIHCDILDGMARVEWTSDAFPIVGTMFATTTDLTVPDLYAVWQGISDYSSA